MSWEEEASLGGKSRGHQPEGRPYVTMSDQGVLKETDWASLVVQRLRVCLPTQGTRVRALVWEDPTCRGAAGPVSHNY